MDKNKKIRGLDAMEPDRKAQEKYKENEVETFILKPQREGIGSLTESEKERYLNITREELEKLKIKSTFIIVWESTVDLLRKIENRNALGGSDNPRRDDDENER